ncbi:MAG: pentapeptide repeat-containing protein [Anaerolineae bacterium]
MKADFSVDEYDGQVFKKLTYSQQSLRHKQFTDCSFTDCGFKETQFEGCVFRGCTFTDCDLSLVKVQNTAFVDSSFEGCKLVGVNWIDADWSKASIFGLPTFTRCTLNYSTFIGLKLKKLRLINCIAHDVDFSDTDLTLAVCTGTDFAESRFVKTNLTEADFTGASNYTISPNLSILKKAKFSLPEAVSLLYGLDIVLVDTDAYSDNP